MNVIRFRPSCALTFHGQPVLAFDGWALYVTSSLCPHYRAVFESQSRFFHDNSQFVESDDGATEAMRRYHVAFGRRTTPVIVECDECDHWTYVLEVNGTDRAGVEWLEHEDVLPVEVAATASRSFYFVRERGVFDERKIYNLRQRK